MVILQLSPEEKRAISFRQAARRPLSADYLEFREKTWNERLAHAREKGKKLWNGTVYTVDNFLQFDESRLVIELGTCEYKDIVLQVNLGGEAVVDRFGSDHLLHYTVADCIPVTSDGKAVFGLRAPGTNVEEGALGLIGGTLNHDERSVSSMADVQEFMRKEIDEETGLLPIASELSLHALNFYRSKYEFLFTCRLSCSSAELGRWEKPGEFSRLLAFSAQELAASRQPQLDAVRFCGNYLGGILGGREK